MVTVGLVVVVVIFAAIWASRYVKVGPNEVLVVSGRKHRYIDPDGSVQTRGFRVRKGGGTFVIPVIEKVDRLSLELLTIDVQQEQDVYTSKGVPVRVDGVAQIKVKGDDISIATAVGTVPEQRHGCHQEHRDADARRPSARDPGHDDRGGHLPEPGRLRPESPGGGGGRYGEHGPGHRQLHHPRHQGQPGLPRCVGQAAYRPGQARRPDRPGRGRPGCDDQVVPGDPGRAGSKV